MIALARVAYEAFTRIDDVKSDYVRLPWADLDARSQSLWERVASAVEREAEKDFMRRLEAAHAELGALAASGATSPTQLGWVQPVGKP